MSDRLKQIEEKSPRVEASLASPGYWRPAGSKIGPTGAAVVALADFHWMIAVIRSESARITDLEAAVQKVLEADKSAGWTDLEPALRNLRSVWARA